MSRATPPLRLGVSVGDPAGIGPEVVSAAARRLATCDEFELRVYGDLDAVERAGGLPHGIAAVDCSSAEVEPGKPDPAAGEGVVRAIELAARACLSGELDALVTGPISKEVLGRAGYTFPGHTELLEEIARAHAPGTRDGEAAKQGGGRAVMLLVGGSLRVALATIHLPLRAVPEAITRAGLREVLRVLHRDLAERFACRAARIAVCGLNPHAGEGGRFGDEEATIIAPAIADARGEGIAATGPISADSLFARAVAGEFDAVLAMYHDQGLGPLKLHAFGRAVNVTLGLPLIRTSVDHGTAFDIAGKGRADAGSMEAAISLAGELARNVRARSDTP